MQIAGNSSLFGKLRATGTIQCTSLVPFNHRNIRCIAASSEIGAQLVQTTYNEWPGLAASPSASHGQMAPMTNPIASRISISTHPSQYTMRPACGTTTRQRAKTESEKWKIAWQTKNNKQKQKNKSYWRLWWNFLHFIALKDEAEWRELRNVENRVTKTCFMDMFIGWIFRFIWCWNDHSRGVTTLQWHPRTNVRRTVRNIVGHHSGLMFCLYLHQKMHKGFWNPKYWNENHHQSDLLDVFIWFRNNVPKTEWQLIPANVKCSPSFFFFAWLESSSKSMCNN